MQVGGMSNPRQCSEQINVLLEVLFGTAKRPERVCLQEVQKTATLNVQYVNKNVAFLKANTDPVILDDMSTFKLQSLVSQQQFQATVGDEKNVDDIIVLNTELM